MVADMPRQVWAFNQEDVVHCFRKLFPSSWFEGFKFPFIEDLGNFGVFMDYFGRRSAVGPAWD